MATRRGTDCGVPGFVNWDLRLTKRVWFLPTQAVTIRADLLNAFNQDDYGNPISNMTNPDFGRNVNDWGNRSATLSLSYTF
jgi:hypothetical protein